jgi:hypothetical protein
MTGKGGNNEGFDEVGIAGDGNAENSAGKI